VLAKRAVRQDRAVRWATWRRPGTFDDRVGVVVDGEIRSLPPGPALVDLLGDLERHGRRAARTPFDVVELDAVELRAPVPHPPAVRDFYAFEQHVKTAREGRGMQMDPDWYELPVFYFSNPHSIAGPGADVRVPPGCEWLDYELEVAAIVGQEGADLDAASAATTHIAGFCIMNDWSARDLQGREMRQMLGPAKGKDFATSLGPFLVTPDELPADLALTMTATVNGREYSRGRLGDLHWSWGEILAYASRGTRVVPGDVIGSGTVGTGCILELSISHGSDAYPWLRSGDEVVLEVERLGQLRNRIV
jgi:2-keto-4-pentenoate hydratase/2-oxohepta-3-ene-1,7-dioic acid hydratase in catechol pathway